MVSLNFWGHIFGFLTKIISFLKSPVFYRIISTQNIPWNFLAYSYHFSIFHRYWNSKCNEIIMSDAKTFWWIYMYNRTFVECSSFLLCCIFCLNMGFCQRIESNLLLFSLQQTVIVTVILKKNEVVPFIDF